MKQTLYVHGAGGHGRAVTAAALDLGYEVIQTDKSENTEPPEDQDCIIAIGNNKIRRKHDRPNMISVVHPSSFVSQGAVIRKGVYIGPGVRIISGSEVGRGSIINTGAIVEHDCKVGPWCHISPGAVICGQVELGEGCWIGANAVIKECLTIAPWTTVGCGASVVRDIYETGTYVGVPARII